MQFRLEQHTEFLQEQIRTILCEKGHVLGKEGICISYQKKEDDSKQEASGLHVEIKKDDIIITASKLAYFFRGLTKALQYLDDLKHEKTMESMVFREEVTITETANFPICGTMFDCSRNGVLQVETVKRYIEKMAQLGMNCLMLYMEDTYAIKEYPYFGAFRGRYSEAELRECDDYADSYGIELIPCIQTLAHLHTPFRFPAFKGYKDNEDILLVGEEKVYHLIETMIQTLTKCFRSKKIHLGMDEAHGLGLGEYLRRNGYQERFQIMNSHLQRVQNICRKYELEPSIWSDMYFRLLSPTGDYYDIPYETKEEQLTKPPEGIELVYWDYYHDDEELYQNYFRLHKALSDQTSFAGGGWIWNGIAPNYAKMLATTNAALKACVKANKTKETISSVICTLWQDNGAETPMAAAIPSIALFAEYCFKERVEMDSVKKFFAYVFDENWEDYMLLDSFDHVPGVLPNNSGADNPSKYLLYQDPMLGLFDGQIAGWKANQYYGALEEKLKEVSARSKNKLFDYYQTLAKVLSVKAELGIRIKEAYDKKDTDTLTKISETILEQCKADMKELLHLRRDLWFEECKPFGFEILDIRLQGVIARLESTQMRLQDFLSGKTEHLEELEEERLVFERDDKNKEHTQCSCPYWQNVISAGNINGI